MIESQPNIDGLPLIVEIQDKNLIYTGHALQFDMQFNTPLDGHVLGNVKPEYKNRGWVGSLVGVGDFVIREAEPKKEERKMTVSFYSIEYVQELEERVAQLETQLAGCTTAAMGATDNVAVEGDYGWSPAYQSVLELRQKHDALLLARSGGDW